VSLRVPDDDERADLPDGPSRRVAEPPGERPSGAHERGASRWSRLRRRVPTTLWVAFLVETTFLIAAGATDGLNIARSGEPLRIALSYLAIIALFSLVHLLAGARPRLARGISSALLVAIIAADVGRQVTMGALDWEVVRDSHGTFFAMGRDEMSRTLMQRGGLVFAIVVPLVAGFLVYRFRSERWPLSRRARVFAAAACAGILVLLPAARIGTHESLTSFVTSIVRSRANDRAVAAAMPIAPYPYAHEFVPSTQARAIAKSDNPRPHVIVLIMESFNGLFVDRQRADGRPYTPVFDAHRRDGLGVATFYAASVHTTRGHFSTMCSLPPMIGGTEFTDLTRTHFHCLPSVLREAGYRTFFYSATNEPFTNNAQGFLTEQVGFEAAIYQDEHQRGRDPNVWGGGLQDDMFYRRFFEAIDGRLSENVPIFAVAGNASNHYSFRDDPHHVPDPDERSSGRRDYVGSLGASDRWLSVFFDELERRPRLRDALVVLVGDHGFPAEEHGIRFNMIGSYEEAFRTAFLLVWRGHVEPAVRRDRAFSQIDVAPTIVDALQLRHRTHFVGTSMFADGPTRGAPMLQPWDGVHLVATRHPWKLVHHEAAEKEHLYDLSSDPNEEHDLISSTDPAALPELRDAILRLRVNQRLLREDRIWPH